MLFAESDYKERVDSPEVEKISPTMLKRAVSCLSRQRLIVARMNFKLAAMLVVGCFCRIAWAEIKLPKLLSDHAVLQRDAPVHLWGWALPDVHLTLHMHAQTISAIANHIGEWDATLMPEKAGGPYSLTIDGDGHAEVHDVLLGDVWLASGQSNMEMPLEGFVPNAPVKDGLKEIAIANHPTIRLLHMAHRASDYPLNNVEDIWKVCTPELAPKFSAVAYFFARELSVHEHVAIGIVDASWGGTPADAFVSLDTLASNPQLLAAFQARAAFADTLASGPAVLALEKREDDDAKAAGRPTPAHPWHPTETSWTPAGIYNGMIAPAVPYTLKGFIWYQGETNSGPARASHYVTLFPALIQDWRTHFAQGDLPFLFVQISSFDSPAEDWGLIRDAQRRTLYLRNTAMAVSLDVGLADNVHPPDKQTVGTRLALAARATVYGEAVPYASPLFREATSEPGALRVWFDHAEGLSSHGKQIAGFEIAGVDRHFIPAEACLQGESVLVSAPTIVKPLYVRYLWQNVAPAPLYNNADLPASTFSSEPAPL